MGELAFHGAAGDHFRHASGGDGGSSDSGFAPGILASGLCENCAREGLIGGGDFMETLFAKFIFASAESFGAARR